MTTHYYKGSKFFFHVAQKSEPAPHSVTHTTKILLKEAAGATVYMNLSIS